MGTSQVAEFLGIVLPKDRPSFRHNPVQVAYAGSISQALAMGPGKIHFIEGDTGIGKSLAYLITLADWVARGRKVGRQAVLATHSRALQRQLMAPENQDILRDYLDSQGLPAVTLGLRMGKKNYVCRERLARALEVGSLTDAATDMERPAVERQIARWALETEGCLLDLEESDLPEGMSTDDIALHDADPVPEHLSEHFDGVQQADIQIINHTLLAMDLVTQQAITGVSEPAVVLLDEAEHFPAVAQQLLSKRLSFGITRLTLLSLGLVKVADTWRHLMQAHCSEELAGQAQLVSTNAKAQLVEGLRAIQKARPRKSRLEDVSLRHDWERLREDAGSLLEALERGSDMLALTHSPVKGLPSLALYESGGGGIIKSNMSERVTILTSATLSDLGHGPGEPPKFSYVRGELLLGASDTRIGLERSHQALDFGQISFALPEAPVAPLVKVSGGQFKLHSRYAQYAWDSIGPAGGGRTLVLCVSYADVEALMEACPEPLKARVVTHGRGAALTRLAEQMPENGILLTPAGWEGLSPARVGDEAFWKHVVLLRNPTPRPDPVVELVLVRHFMQKMSRDEAIKRAIQGVMSKGLVRSVHKIRQGLGRTIRHPDDVVNVTILDPRFPRPGASKLPGVKVSPRLLGAIPFRFLGAYEDSETGQSEEFERDGLELIL